MVLTSMLIYFILFTYLFFLEGKIFSFLFYYFRYKFKSAILFIYIIYNKDFILIDFNILLIYCPIKEAAPPWDLTKAPKMI